LVRSPQKSLADIQSKCEKLLGGKASNVVRIEVVSHGMGAILEAGLIGQSNQISPQPNCWKELCKESCWGFGEESEGNDVLSLKQHGNV